MNSSGSYDKALLQDYPSLGQVSLLAKENAINTIFAVTQEVGKTYEAFSKLIPFADYGIVMENASNLVDLIYEKYKACILIYNVTLYHPLVQCYIY